MKTLFICASRINNIVVFILLFLGTQSYSHVNLKLAPIDATHYALKLDFDIDEYEGIYEQYLSISIDDPDIVLPKLECSIEPTVQYAPAFKSSKSLFLGPCSFKGIIEVPSADYLETAHLYVTHRLLSQKHSQTIVLSLSPKGDSSLLPAVQIQNCIDIPQTVDQAPTEKITPAVGKKKDPLSTFVDNKSISAPTKARHPSLHFASQNTQEERKDVLTPELAQGLPSRKECSCKEHQAWMSDGPDLIPLGILSIFCMLMGLFLIFKGSYAKQLHWRPIAATLGMALVACSIVVTTKAYQAQYLASHPSFHEK